MGRLYSFLGLSVGVVQEHHSKRRRRAAFEADITYVTSNALGFTYLLDTSTAMSPDELVNGPCSPMHCARKGPLGAGRSPHSVASPSDGLPMHLGGCSSAEVHVMQAILRPFNYAIVDEADSVLIDDCMTPLVLSAASDTVSKDLYVLAHKVRHSHRVAAACSVPHIQYYCHSQSDAQSAARVLRGVAFFWSMLSYPLRVEGCQCV